MDIPVPLEMPEEVYAGYKHAEDTLRRFMKRPWSFLCESVRVQLV